MTAQPTAANTPKQWLDRLLDASGRGQLDTLDQLAKAVGRLDINASDSHGRTALHYACRRGQARSVRWLLNHSAKVPVFDEQGRSPLHSAARGGHDECVQILLAEGARVDAQDKDCWTPLHCAALDGHAACCDILLRRGANINKRNQSGRTSLLFAASNGKTECVLLLLRRGADINSQDSEGYSALHWASFKCHRECLHVLVTHRADVNVKDKSGYTPLQWAAFHGDVESIDELLKYGASIKSATNDGTQPLYWSAQRGHLAAVKLLWSRGADINCQTSDGSTPLHAAAQEGKVGCVKFLLSVNANPSLKTKSGHTALDVATGDCVGLIRTALSGGGVTRGDTPENQHIHRAPAATTTAPGTGAGATRRQPVAPAPVVSKQPITQPAKPVLQPQQQHAHANQPGTTGVGGVPAKQQPLKTYIASGAHETGGGGGGGGVPRRSGAATQPARAPPVGGAVSTAATKASAPMGPPQPMQRSTVANSAATTPSQSQPHVLRNPSAVSSHSSSISEAQDLEMKRMAEELERVREQLRAETMARSKAEKAYSKIKAQAEHEQQQARARSTSTSKNDNLPNLGYREIRRSELVTKEKLGAGGFGKVHRAMWQGKDVAVKTLRDQALSPEALQEFRSEIGILSTLRHPNIVLFMGACTKSGELCIVTEFMKSGSLFDVIHKSRTPIDVLSIAKQVAQGMNYIHLHEPQIIHRDLKSPNILLDEHGVAKIADFGLSRTRMDNKTMTGEIGTPQWTAPEILRNNRYTEKVDVYSFGVILWELVCRQVPYKGLSSMQVAANVHAKPNFRPPIPSMCPRDWARLMQMCWHEEPSQRPTFAQLLDTLNNMSPPGGVTSMAPMNMTPAHGPAPHGPVGHPPPPPGPGGLPRAGGHPPGGIVFH